ncbi:hypothetical protein CEXT_69011 [Caerostris extrusa]|uniref:Uncharacterized protein n=1 Tax=Caerostris extrusa TaxID=172846 RepID=A0AAV4TI66_CAEEX|nr:hypothetical protein CEXT_69011 [Caerostris extrusa]
MRCDNLLFCLAPGVPDGAVHADAGSDGGQAPLDLPAVRPGRRRTHRPSRDEGDHRLHLSHAGQAHGAQLRTGHHGPARGQGLRGGSRGRERDQLHAAAGHGALMTTDPPLTSVPRERKSFILPHTHAGTSVRGVSN